jgi:hydroxymethylglutaryl-CoA reductase (NADPH)
MIPPSTLRKLYTLRSPRGRSGGVALSFKVEDCPGGPRPRQVPVPCSKEDNYSPAIIAARQDFVEGATGVKLEHTSRFSFDPRVTAGNIENFTGVVQVPLGFAGPLLVKGEHAQGEFLIPLATTEGTLVASYNRGMKVLNLSGGVTCTVQSDHMQRAPVFIFDSAREALAFRRWVEAHMDDIRREAEATTGSGKLLYIDTYLASKFAYLRFNFRTGDAAGQNMVGRATFAACTWILERNRATVRRFFLESNLATDKKASQVNVLHTRGKRVTAECVVQRKVLLEVMHAEPESLAYHWGVANVGSILSGASNNGAHSPNALAAMFIATGQDVANLAEGSSGILYTELTPERDLYISITIPSLIVATHGGGTGLTTQRECLQVLGCLGTGKVYKLAEIMAGVVLAGELSLGAAISSHEWVSSHEKYGRNR